MVFRSFILIYDEAVFARAGLCCLFPEKHNGAQWGREFMVEGTLRVPFKQKPGVETLASSRASTSPAGEGVEGGLGPEVAEPAAPDLRLTLCFPCREITAQSADGRMIGFASGREVKD